MDEIGTGIRNIQDPRVLEGSVPILYLGRRYGSCESILQERLLLSSTTRRYFKGSESLERLPRRIPDHQPRFRKDSPGGDNHQEGCRDKVESIGSKNG